jgi:hypothetical protein
MLQSAANNFWINFSDLGNRVFMRFTTKAISMSKVLILDPKVFGYNRSFFYESFNFIAQVHIH